MNGVRRVRPAPLWPPDVRGSGPNAAPSGSATYDDRQPDRPAPEIDMDWSTSGSGGIVLLPTLNERDGLQRTLEELATVPWPDADGPPSVLVIDGRSTDGTLDVADANGVRVLVQQSRGKGAAIREGLAWARSHGFDRAVVLDADGTYPAHEIPSALALLAMGTQVVIGIRRPTQPSDQTARDLVHRIGNGLLNYSAAQFSRRPVLDVCSGFWGVRLEDVERLELASNGFDIEAELFVKAFRAGFRVVQFPVEYRPRVGEAKLHAVRDGARIFLAIAQHSVRPLPPVAPSPPSPTSEAARGASGRTAFHLADLCSAILALHPPSVVLLGVDDRANELRALGKMLQLSRPSLEIRSETTPTPLDHPAWWSLLSPLDLGGLGAGSAAPLVVGLPPLGDPLTGPAGAVFGIPNSGAVVRVMTGGTAGSVRRFRDHGSTPRLRLEGSNARRPHAVSLLGAMLDLSGIQRELALVCLNPCHSSVAVFLPTARPPRRARDLVGAIPVIGGWMKGVRW